MNMHTTIPPGQTRAGGVPSLPDTAAAIWAEACRDRAAIARNTRGFIRLTKMLSAFERNDVELAVDLLIDAFDRIDGDADLHDGIEAELTTDCCAAGEDHLNDAPPILGHGDIPWTEFHTRGRHMQQRGHEPLQSRPGACTHEDAENDDADTDQDCDREGGSDDDMCLAGDDGCGQFIYPSLGAGIAPTFHFGTRCDAGIELPTPTYGIDQSRGPLLEALADVAIANAP